MKDFFLEIKDEHISAYNLDVITAVREKDITTLRKMHQQGLTLQCCNRFGESIIHMACRRGLFEVVKFLVEEAGLSILLRDDYGRTPLHDAFWTPKPEPEL